MILNSTLWKTVLLLLGLALFSSPTFAKDLLQEYYRTPSTKAVLTESGLAYQVLKKGRGKNRPSATATVTVHYTGWLASNGVLFDSSVARGKPAVLPLNRVIAGWTQGLQLMRVGELTRFWIPADLAYGNDSTSTKPVGPLVFEIKLLSIAPETKPVTIQAPKMEIPKKATITKSGLAYQVLKKGRGQRYPNVNDTVLIHYSAWQASDGHMFDSSVLRDSPQPLPLQRTIKGLAEGIQLMLVGDQTRFWIPAKLAYGDSGVHGSPAGLVIYDIELLAIP